MDLHLLNELPAWIVALWFGLLTSIAPCPLATNIASITFIGRQVESPKRVCLAGLLYTIGRAAAYLALAALLLWGLSSDLPLTHLVGKYANKFLGPVMILIGMLLTGLLEWNWALNLNGQAMQEKVKRLGMLAAFPLGIVFALAFCPTTLVYFGMLIEYARAHESSVLLPGVYGLGTGLPVAVFAVLIALGGKYLGKAYSTLTRAEKVMRILTGAIFIAVGIYYALTYIYGVEF